MVRPARADCRALLQRAAADAAQEGITFAFGSEMEFYLFRRDENGEPTRIPYDNAGYMDIAPEDKGENVRREICLTLEQMGIQPERSHHEEGPGQNEIDFRYADPVTAADNAVTFPHGGAHDRGAQRSVRRFFAQTSGTCAGQRYACQFFRPLGGWTRRDAGGDRRDSAAYHRNDRSF